MANGIALLILSVGLLLLHLALQWHVQGKGVESADLIHLPALGLVAGGWVGHPMTIGQSSDVVDAHCLPLWWLCHWGGSSLK